MEGNGVRFHVVFTKKVIIYRQKVNTLRQINHMWLNW
nr:MAG TPA: hypothetical protein [Caudoviricetes sp.]